MIMRLARYLILVVVIGLLTSLELLATGKHLRFPGLEVLEVSVGSGLFLALTGAYLALIGVFVAPAGSGKTVVVGGRGEGGGTVVDARRALPEVEVASRRIGE